MNQESTRKVDKKRSKKIPGDYLGYFVRKSWQKPLVDDIIEEIVTVLNGKKD